jgi:hypothetical protein
LPRLFRRNPTHWDWGPSKFGRCPYDDPSYTGRAVDVMLWVIPDRPDPIEGLREWLSERVAKKPMRYARRISRMNRWSSSGPNPDELSGTHRACHRHATRQQDIPPPCAGLQPRVSCPRDVATPGHIPH